MAELQALEVMASAARPQARALTHADTCKLPYLNAVIKVRTSKPHYKQAHYARSNLPLS